MKLNRDWRFLGRLNFAIADNDTANVRAADFIEGVAGFAYRPVDNDKLNILARYNYFRDLGPVGQVTEGGEANSPKQVSQIISIDASYDLADWFTLGGKYGYRQGRVSLGRGSDDFVSSNTRYGALAAIYRHIGNNAKIGVGYSFTDSSDDLADQSYTSKGFFVNLLGKF